MAKHEFENREAVLKLGFFLAVAVSQICNALKVISEFGAESFSHKYATVDKDVDEK